jgi:hypothetical protein
MEVSLVRKRVLEGIERARQAAAGRRAANEAARQAWDQVLERVAVPLVRQVAQVLKASGYGFQVFTPAGAVRLSSERSSEDYIELALDTSGAIPEVVGRISRVRGREHVEEARVVGRGGPIESLDEEQLLEFLLGALAPFVER